jgi:hypothetical protein
MCVVNGDVMKRDMILRDVMARDRSTVQKTPPRRGFQSCWPPVN